MSSFDYIAEALAIRDALGDDLVNWKGRIDDAIGSGSTGTEILMSVRWNLAELLKVEPGLPSNLVARIKDYLLAANKLLE